MHFFSHGEIVFMEKIPALILLKVDVRKRFENV